MFRDYHGSPLYIGKSTQLKKRVRGYFRPSIQDRKMAHIRSLTRTIDVLKLESDFQAREVEMDLIRSYRPRLNTVYLDYMHRPLVRITVNDPFPRVEVVSSRQDDDAKYFGPFRSTRRLRRILDILGDCLPFRTCDHDIPPEGRPGELEQCHRAQLNRCNAPCVGEESVENYTDRIEKLIEFLEGDHGPVLNELESSMNEHAGNYNFEAANLLKEYREAIKRLIEYEPFIRETLDGEFLYIDPDSELAGHVAVREHRVKQVTIGRDAIDGKRNRNTLQKPLDRRVISNEHGRNETSIKTHTPSNDEERTLLEALSDTVSIYRRLPERETPILDRVNPVRGQIERTVDGEFIDRVDWHGYSGDPMARLSEHYSHFIEKGIPLPDEVVLDGEPTPEKQLKSVLDGAVRRLSEETVSRGQL